MKSKIEKLTITLGERKLEFTMEEATELLRILNEAIGPKAPVFDAREIYRRQSQAQFAPPAPFIPWTGNPNPFRRDEIICQSGGFQGQLSEAS